MDRVFTNLEVRIFIILDNLSFMFPQVLHGVAPWSLTASICEDSIVKNWMLVKYRKIQLPIYSFARCCKTSFLYIDLLTYPNFKDSTLKIHSCKWYFKEGASFVYALHGKCRPGFARKEKFFKVFLTIFSTIYRLTII